MTEPRHPVPPFTRETALQKVQAAVVRVNEIAIEPNDRPAAQGSGELPS